ncbi:MAG: type II toxin-antitoxin system RelE/ParE family toxin [Cytophagales bacterium]
MGIYLGKNCDKLRISIATKGKGKSGGARVITYVKIVENTVYLLSIYDKSEKENLLNGELEEFIGKIELPL